MATMKVWYHAGPAQGSFGVQSLVSEPELAAETVTTSGTAADGAAVPTGASVAVCYSDTLTYYRVRRAGDTTAATSADKWVAASEFTHVSVKAGDTISFIE